MRFHQLEDWGLDVRYSQLERQEVFSLGISAIFVEVVSRYMAGYLSAKIEDDITDEDIKELASMCLGKGGMTCFHCRQVGRILSQCPLRGAEGQVQHL